MRCREAVDSLGAYVDGELPEARRAPLEEHLGKCPDCAAYLATYRRTVRLAGDAFPEPSPELPDDLVNDVLARRKR